MVTYQRKEILIENIELLRNSFRKALSKYDFEIIASIKKNFSYYLENKPLKNDLSQSMQYRKEAGVWQRRFYDHIIRNEEDFNKHINYIHYNSYKHYQIAPKEWEYSSFKKFVDLGFYEENWCDFEDNMLDLE